MRVVATARRGDGASWLRSAFRATGQRPQWHLVGFAVAGLLVGLVLGVAADPWEVALLPALTAGLVAATGAAGPSAVAVRVAGFAAASTVVLVCLGFVASDRPWLAAALMAAVAVFTSAAFGAGPVGGAVGVLGTLAFVMALVLSTATSARQSATLAEVALRVSAAAALGWVVVLVGSRWRERGAHTAAPAVRVPAPWQQIWHSVRTMDEHARDGVRRAVPLTACAFWYQWSGSHDALWVFISAMAVLLPTGKSTLEAAAFRVLATVLGVLVVGVAADLVPVAVLVGIAVAALLFGMAYKPVVPVLAGAASALSVVVLVGAPSGAVGSVASRRLLDTLIGAGLALASTYLLWPRDQPDLPQADDAEVIT